MKKFISLLLLAGLVLTMFGCQKKVTVIVDDEPASGDWTVQETEVSFLSEEEQEILDKALEGYTGLSVKPVAVIASQVVAGRNLAYLCLTAPVVPDAVSKYSVVFVYNDLDGNATITDVKDIDVAKYKDAGTEMMEQGLAGGWTVSDTELTPINSAAFDKATANLLGSTLEPYALLATQVVKGTNYAFFVRETMVTQTPVVNNGIVFIYEDLEGNAFMSNVEYFDVTNILE